MMLTKLISCHRVLTAGDSGVLTWCLELVLAPPSLLPVDTWKGSASFSVKQRNIPTWQGLGVTGYIPGASEVCSVCMQGELSGCSVFGWGQHHLLMSDGIFSLPHLPPR